MADKIEFIPSADALIEKCKAHIVALRHQHAVVTAVVDAMKARYPAGKSVNARAKKYLEEAISAAFPGALFAVSEFSLKQAIPHMSGHMSCYVAVGNHERVRLYFSLTAEGLDAEYGWQGYRLNLTHADWLEERLPRIPEIVAEYNNALAALCRISTLCLADTPPYRNVHPLSEALSWYQLAGDCYKEGELRRRGIIGV